MVTLLLISYLVNGWGNPTETRVESMPGFKSVQACEAAAVKIQSDRPPYFNFKTYCLKDN